MGETQRIHQRCKNASNGLSDYYYFSGSFKSFKISDFDTKDHEKSIKWNNIPIWNCPRCTFRNTRRKSLCSICNLSYKASKSYTSKENKPKQTESSTVTLADFCSEIVEDSNYINESIPVWICRECTYCNIEQLPQCQMCFASYYEYFCAAEQELIIESVQCKQSEMERNKYSMEQLKEFRESKECHPMPTNIICEIPQILSPGLGLKTFNKPKRARFTMKKLMDLRESEQCQAMPDNVICAVPDILGFGLGKTKKLKPRKFTIKELMEWRRKKECKLMPKNMMHEISEILSDGLGLKRLDDFNECIPD